jgi:four helix bundle protein
VPTTADLLRARTKQFGFDVVDLVKQLPRNIAGECVARQLIRAGTGVASNHRAACRGRSRREFIARLGVVLEEADESELWLEVLIACELAPGLPGRASTSRSRRAARHLLPIAKDGARASAVTP